jgi:hypothetical protein
MTPNPPVVKPYLIRGFQGLNTGLVAQNIKDGQFQELENWYPYQGILYRRKGLTKISGLALGEALTSLYAYKVSAGTWTLIAGTPTRLAKLDEDEMVYISHVDATTYTSDNRPWVFKQYKDVVYAARQNAGTLQRTDGLSVGDAGIAAPTAAPTLADGAAGDIEAGDYYGVYTYYNTVTYAESNYSPVSAKLAAAGSKKINWTGLVESTNAQANAYRLYRTQKGQTGEYFLVATVTSSGVTSYTGDNVLTEDMGAAATTKNGLPPGGCIALEVFQERLWTTDGTDLWFSEIGLPESYGSANYISVAPDDGHKIVGLKAFSERLLIGKTNAVYYLTGTDRLSFELRTLTDRHGVYSQASMAVTEGLCFWFGGDNFYMTDGNKVTSIGSVEMSTYIEGIQSAYFDRIVGAALPSKGWYVAGIPYGAGATEINVLLVYAYKTGDWTAFTYDSSIGCPQFLGDFYSTNGEHIIYAPTDAVTGHVYQFESNDNDDAGYDIACVARTKSFGFDEDDTMKFMKEIQILVSTTGEAEDVTATLYRDDESSAEDTFSLNTYGGKLWKRVNVANNGDLGNFMDLKIEYSGNADFKLAGLGFKIVDTRRQTPVIS